MRGHFSIGSQISWSQYARKDATLGVIRSGDVWADCPTLDGAPGAHVWVVPTTRLAGENGAIAVRVYRSGTRRGEAELYEDSPAYRQYSLKESANADHTR